MLLYKHIGVLINPLKRRENYLQEFENGNYREFTLYDFEIVLQILTKLPTTYVVSYFTK